MRQNHLILLSIIAVMALIAGIILLNSSNTQQDEEKLKVVASFYPLAFFTQEIGGDKVEVSSLIPYNSEVHSWQPSIGDISKAEDADILIYNGAGLDHWVEDDLLGSISTKDKVIVEASQGMVLLASGEQGEEDHGGGDPHLWVSPHTAVTLAERVAEALMEADPDNSAYYEERWLALEQRFTDMDTRYSNELAAYSGKTFFTTHAAYGYVADRYGLKQHGVIGLSADEQPSTETLTGIVEGMIEEGAHAIYIDPVYSDAYAKTLKTEMEAKTGEPVMILHLYLMLGPVDDLDYFQQLESNLENLKLGLGG
jgi:zinc transport system substrate-binding protein